ncbi:MAG: 16S rRNA processing protein RimM [Saprospiraceae bacterium]|nr:16S rRNA processing protein RimM [Saprospiraceae bacterium]MCB9323685.1 16S rRNA processing protein RimM [Lewinellaceae bacterium]
MEKYIQIGFALKTHGVGGEIKFNIEDEYWDDFEEADVLFLEVSGRKTPYFVEEIKSGGSMLLVKFEDINSREEASALTSRPVFMREKDMSEKEEEDLRVEDMFDLLPGYMIVDMSGKEVGEIKEVLEFPQQIMAVVDYNEREILIPLNDVFIKGIDQRKKAILMELPEGMLEL